MASMCSGCAKTGLSFSARCGSRDHTYSIVDAESVQDMVEHCRLTPCTKLLYTYCAAGARKAVTWYMQRQG